MGWACLQEGCATAHLVLGAVSCAGVPGFTPKGQDSLHLGTSCSVKTWSPPKIVTSREGGQNGKSTASSPAGSRNLRQTQDFSVFQPKKLFFGLSDTLSCLADQDLAQGTEFRSFKNVGIPINKAEDLPIVGGKHSEGRFPQEQSISWSRLSTRGTNKVSKAETLDQAHLTLWTWCSCPSKATLQPSTVSQGAWQPCPAVPCCAGCCAQVIAGLPHRFMSPSIPSCLRSTTRTMSSSVVSAILFTWESYVFCPGPHCIQNSYLASISPLLKPFPFCNLIKLTKRSLF